MNNDKANLQQLTISNPDRTRKFVSAFSYEANEGQAGGERVGFMMEIEYQLVPSPEDIIWAKDFNQDLISFIKENYYQDQAPFSDAYKKFEDLLQRLNKFLIANNLSNKTLNLIVAILDKDNLYFAQIGSALAYLWQNNTLTPLLEGGSDSAKNKRFANIVSGILEEGDQVFFATNNFFDYLPQVDTEEQLRLQKELSIPKLNSLLKKLSDKISLGLLTIKKMAPVPSVETSEPLSTVKPLPKATKKSTRAKAISPAPTLTEPRATEPIENNPVGEKPENKIIPVAEVPTISEVPVALPPTKKRKNPTKKERIKPSVIGADQPLNKITPRLVIEDALLQELTVSTRPNHIDQPPLKTITVILNFFKNIFVKLAIGLVKLLRLDKLVQKINHKFNQLSYLQRSLVILFLILAIIFIQSLVSFGRQEYSKQTEKRYSDLIQQIQAKQQAVGAAIIYKDDAKIKSLTNDINNLLAQLPQNTEEQKAAWQDLKNSLSQQLSTVTHSQTTDNPKIIADLSTVNKQIKIGGLIKLNNYLYCFDPTNNFIYQIDLTTNKISLVSKNSSNIGYLRQVTDLDKDSIIFSSGDSGLAAFNTVSKSFSALNLDSKQTSLTIGDLLVYSDKLYILDNKNSNILRYTKTASGFGKEESWLKTPLNLQSAVSFAADGSIYILLNNGLIDKFYRGEKQSFVLKSVSPLITKPTKIITWLDSKYIYILEPLNKRLIVFDKNGGLIKQITSSAFTNLSDVTISEKEDTAWLLNDKTIFEINLK